MNLILIVAFAAWACLVNGQYSCRALGGRYVNCISIYECKPLLAVINKKNRTSQDTYLLEQSLCDEVKELTVCCPRISNPAPQPQDNLACNTPEGHLGKCISIYSCPHLAEMVKPPVPKETFTYLQNSKCNGPEQYSVCCGPPPKQDRVVVPDDCAAKVTAFPPDPHTGCCGVDSRFANKILGGNETKIDQYPWLVLIEYKKEAVTKLLCSGTLISGKYALTTGHCVVGPVLQSGIPIRVRLGEYDISNEGPDCVPSEAGVEDCTDGVTRIDIEKTIPHPQYNPESPMKRNDIALIRLKENAPFTDFIRPICLPTKDLTQPRNIPANFILYAAGWGAVSLNQSYSNIKLHVDVPFVSQDMCQNAYSSPGRTITLWNGHLCAGGIKRKDTCKGDTGGPLMYKDGITYEVVGITSYGPVPCGVEGIPGVYSKVYEYLDWIRDVIVP